MHEVERVSQVAQEDKRCQPDEARTDPFWTDYEVDDANSGSERGRRYPPDDHSFLEQRGIEQYPYQERDRRCRRNRENPCGPALPSAQVSVVRQQAEQASEEYRIGPGVEGVVHTSENDVVEVRGAEDLP